MTQINTYFKNRLNYLGTRMAELDLINIAYYPFVPDTSVIARLDGPAILLTAQVGRTLHDMILDNSSMLSSLTRDYFIFSEDYRTALTLWATENDQTGMLQQGQPNVPQEGDIILDAAYDTSYARVASINSLPTFKYTNETNVRMRIHTSTVAFQKPQEFSAVPDLIATWLRADAVPQFEPEFTQP